jgi:transcriptional regulator with XRE-family HTH domain
VAKELGISSGAVTNWKNGAVPQSATLKRIADYFGVSTSYLLGIVDNPDPIALVDPSKKAPPLIEKIDEAMLDMSEEDLKDLEKYVEFILSRKKG